VVSGETVDIAERGAALAAKYPDVGMSAEMIGQAIERAAGMVGMIKSAPEPKKQALDFTARAPQPAGSNGQAASAPAEAPVNAPVPIAAPLAQSIDDDLASAIDAEIGNLVAEKRSTTPAASSAAAAKPKISTARFAPIRNTATRPASASPTAKSAPPAPTEKTEETPEPIAASQPTEPPVSNESEVQSPSTQPRAKGPIAAFRRALFGA
jgi:hypothetical protein